ncbi:MAG: hypothetical protein FWD15_01035 [Alphaproteobacteria bacterium]|nr:hypothetical protein [Alphaproteobacteria bacterium]
MQNSAADAMTTLRFLLDAGEEYEFSDSPARLATSNKAPAFAPVEATSDTPLLSTDDIVEQAASISATANTLDELYEKLAAFSDCPLAKFATTIVKGFGAAAAPKLLIISELPTIEDDKSGAAFSDGAEGALLKSMLAKAGLSEAEVHAIPASAFITPGRRALTAPEMKFLAPILARIIELIKPKAILALGSAAPNILFARGDSVAIWRAEKPIMNGIPIHTTFSLSAMVKDTSLRKDAWGDLHAALD